MYGKAALLASAPTFSDLGPRVSVFMSSDNCWPRLAGKVLMWGEMGLAEAKILHSPAASGQTDGDGLD